jgi:Domain of unknown function (DUF4279)
MSSATSTTKSLEATTRRAFATLRLSGNRLDPEQVSGVLGVCPSKAWRKGERYHAGKRTGWLVGNTGVWFLATDEFVVSSRLDDHLQYLVALLSCDTPLRELIARDNLKAEVSCFWHGAAGEQPPVISSEFIARMRCLPAEIETDFDADQASPVANS